MLDPRRLRLLRDVARTGTIAGAAERAGCTSSAASQQIVALERSLDLALLERSARSVRLTDAGRVLVEHAERVLLALDAAEVAVAAVANLKGGRLRLAAFNSAGSALAIPAMSAFAHQHPEVRLSFRELEPEDAIPAVTAGDIDLAITHQYRHLPRPDLAALSQHLLLEDSLLLAVPPHLRPGDAAPARLTDYRETTWLSTTPSEGFQAITELVCRSAAFEPHVAFRADSYDLMLGLVAADFGVALIPSLAAAPRQGVTYLPIGEPNDLAREIHATTRTADPSPAIQAMVQLLRHRSPRRQGERPGMEPHRYKGSMDAHPFDPMR